MSDNGQAVEPVKERFPTAMVEGAKTTLEVFRAWKEKWGLEPKELTEEQIVQRITLTHDPRTGTLKWETKNLDGLGATLMATEATFLMPCIVTADGAQSIAEYFTIGEGALNISSGEAFVMVAFQNGRLVIDWQPKDTPAPTIAAKKLLACALLRLIAGDTGLPLEKLLRAFG